MGSGDNDMIVGELKGSLDALTKAVDEQSRTSRESRQRTYNKIEELSAAIHRVEGYVERVDGRLAKVEPVAEDFSRWKERGVGVVMFIGAISGIVGAVLAVLWKKVVIMLGLH